MLYFKIPLFVSLILIIYCFREFVRGTEYDWSSYVLAAFTIPVMSFGIIGGAGIVIDAIGLSSNIIETTYETIYEKEISALGDDMGLKGKGRYIVNSITDIKFIVNEGNYKNIKTVDADNCKIYEDNQTKVIYKERVYKNKIIRWLVGDRLIYAPLYELHIPEGSLTTDFNIDLK